MYTAVAVPTRTLESKTTTATSGRAAMLRECRASGDETQKNVAASSVALKYTGVTHGTPSASAVPSVM